MSALTRAVSRSVALPTEQQAPSFPTPPPLVSPIESQSISSTLNANTSPEGIINPLLSLNIDLNSIGKAERQIKLLLRGALNAGVTQQAGAGLGTAQRPASHIVTGCSASGIVQHNNIPNPTNNNILDATSSSAPSPTTKPPVVSSGEQTQQPSPDFSSDMNSQTKSTPVPSNVREGLLAAWERFSKPIKAMHAALKVPLKILIDGYEDGSAHAPLSAARKAELLSELCHAAEKMSQCPSIGLSSGGAAPSTNSRSISPRLATSVSSPLGVISPGLSLTSPAPLSPQGTTVFVPLPSLSSRDVDAAVTVILDALDSPSLVVRLLGLHGARFLCHDRGFFDKFLKHRGFYLVASAIDGEHPQESDYALTLVHTITRLKLKGTLAENIPYYIISRVVSCLDPLDQRATTAVASNSATPPPQGASSGQPGGVTFALKSRCLDMLQLMLKAYPAEMSEADAIRPMLLACLNPSTPKEEMERIVMALLDAFDDPRRRCFIRDSDIGVIFSPFTDHSFREGTMIAQQNNQQSSINASLGLATSSSVGTVTGRAREVICKFLSTWSGMLWLSTETAGIRSLIDALHLPGRIELKLSLIALFNQSLRRMAPHRGIPVQGPWEGTNARQRKGTVMGGGIGDDYEFIDFEDGAGYSDNYYYDYLVGVNEGGMGGYGIADAGGDDYAPITSAVGYHACDVFLGSLLLVLNHHGLPDALIAVMRNAAQRDDSSSGDGISSGEGDHSPTDNGKKSRANASTNGSNSAAGEPDASHQPVSLLREAALLLQHIIVLMDTLLPRATASKLHGSLNEAISSMAADGKSFAGGLTNTLFHNLSSDAAPGGGSIYSSGVIGFGAAGRFGGMSSLMGGVASDAELTEAYFHQLLKESMVIESSSTAISEASKCWNPVAIMSLIEGPLKNPQRLRYARDKTPFIQRLLFFFKISGGATIPPERMAAGSVGGHSSSSSLFPAPGSYNDLAAPTAFNFNQPMSRHHTTLTAVGDARFKWTAIGVALIDLLLSSRDGVETIQRFDMMSGYASLFDEVYAYHQQQIRKGGGAVNTRLSILLTKESLQEGMGIDLLKLLARFTLSANGLNLLKNYRIFDRILNLFVLAASGTSGVIPGATGNNSVVSPSKSPLPELNSGNVSPVPSVTRSAAGTLLPSQCLADLCYLCSKILQYSYVGSVPNFGVCEEFRRMMQIALGPTIEDSGLKNSAIDQLARVIWRDLGGSLTWGIERLLALLDDGNRSIVTRAYKLLSNICFSSGQALDNLIAKGPRALLENKQLVDQRRMLNINALLYRMVGHPQGFAFLTKVGWVEKELDHWDAQGATLFVEDLQQIISRAGSDAQQLSSGNGGGGGSVTPRTNGTRHYRTASMGMGGASAPPNYRQAVTTVTSTMQVAHSIYPDHFVKDLCKHREGCETFSKSTLWLRSIQTLMLGVGNRVASSPKEGSPRRRKKRGDGSGAADGDSSGTEDDGDSDEQSDEKTRLAAAVVSDAAIAAKRRRSIADGRATIPAAPVGGKAIGASTQTTHMRIVGAVAATQQPQQGSSSLIHMLRREAIAEDIDELFEYEGGAAEIQCHNNKGRRNNRNNQSNLHGNGTYYHAGTAGLNTVSTYRRNKRKGVAPRSGGNVSSSSDDDREFSAARGYAPNYGSRMVECLVDPKTLVAAMYVLAFAGSSDYGFELLIRADGTYPPYALLHKFIEITRFAVNPYVRGSALTCLSIICRSQLATSYLTSAYNCSVIHDTSAYVTPNGIPYAVSFLEPHHNHWMIVGRPASSLFSGGELSNSATSTNQKAHQGSSAHTSQRAPPSTRNVPKELQELMMMLLNPVNREKAKGPLAALLKDKPSLIVGNAAVRYMRECSCIYRMRHAERKFLADFFARIRIVRYTHKREKQLQRELEAQMKEAQNQTNLSFVPVHATLNITTQNGNATGVPLIVSSSSQAHLQQRGGVAGNCGVNAPPMPTVSTMKGSLGGLCEKSGGLMAVDGGIEESRSVVDVTPPPQEDTRQIDGDDI